VPLCVGRLDGPPSIEGCKGSQAMLGISCYAQNVKNRFPFTAVTNLSRLEEHRNYQRKETPILNRTNERSATRENLKTVYDRTETGDGMIHWSTARKH